MNHTVQPNTARVAHPRRMQLLSRAIMAPLFMTALCVPTSERTIAQDDERGVFGGCDPVLVPAGQLLLQSKGGSFDFGTADLSPIPADFFDPGSLPFEGQIDFIGVPFNPNSSTADTSIMRLQNAFVGSKGSTATVDIELVQLSLVGIEPIVVDYGTNTELWDVQISLPGGSQPLGEMFLERTHEDGGIFNSDVPVCPLFTFTRQSDSTVMQYNPCDFGDPPILLRNEGEPWIQDPLPDPEPARSDCMYLPLGYESLWEASDVISPTSYLGCQATGPTDCNLTNEPDQLDIINGISNDFNLNWIPDECECPGEVRGVSPGAVDVQDLLALLGAWGPCPEPCPPTCAADINLDCTVGVADLLVLLAGWGPCPAP